MNRPNGGCNCSDPACHTAPVAPIDHIARLEALADIWPNTEGVTE